MVHYPPLSTIYNIDTFLSIIVHLAPRGVRGEDLTPHPSNPTEYPVTATKITLVGAGSTSFGVSMLLDIIANAADLAGSTITLADLNAESLQLMESVANRLQQASSAQLTFEASTDLRGALKGANFVITSVAVDRLATWQKDWEIPLQDKPDPKVSPVKPQNVPYVLQPKVQIF